jgi:hypothetical protein
MKNESKNLKGNYRSQFGAVITEFSCKAWGNPPKPQFKLADPCVRVRTVNRYLLRRCCSVEHGNISHIVVNKQWALSISVTEILALNLGWCKAIWCITILYTTTTSQAILVNKMTRLRTQQECVEYWPENDLFFIPRPQTGSGSHPSSYPTSPKNFLGLYNQDLQLATHFCVVRESRILGAKIHVALVFN